PTGRPWTAGRASKFLVMDDAQRHTHRFARPVQADGIRERSPSMTTETLKSYSYKDLAAMAKRRGVEGWHAMRKDQLVRALSRTAARSKTAHSKSAVAHHAKKPAAAVRRSPTVSATSSPRTVVSRPKAV